MTTGVVKSTPEAIEAIQAMKNILNGGLTEQMNQFISQGNRLNPENWDGAHASQFYGNWPSTVTALNNAITELNETTEHIQSVNTNTQSAGGNQ